MSFFLLVAHPAQAQGSWGISPCNAQGDPISAQTDNQGFYAMGGTESGTVSNTYPGPMIAAALAVPSAYGNYLGAGSPLGITAIPTVPVYPGNGIGGFLGTNLPDYADASAYNSTSATGYGGVFYYSVPASYGSPSSGLINGGVTTSLTGQMVAYFKVQWQGMGTPTTSRPDHINLLLKTQVSASASVFYNNSTQNSGLSAQATASDGAPFNETASVSAGDSYSTSGVPFVQGYHLVTAAVDPNTGVAEAYLNGMVQNQASNNVPYGIVSYPYPNYPGYVMTQTTNGATMASASASVQGGVKQDTRAVSITSSDIETSSFKGTVDAQHPNGVWPEMRLSDGSAFTDSAVSPPLSQPGSVNAWLSSPTLLGQAPGFASPVFAWSLVGGAGTLSASGNTSSTQLSVSFPTSSTDAALNQQSAVNLNVTDTGGITGANTFVVRWHYPYENWIQDPNSPPVLNASVIPGVSPSPTSINVGGSIIAHFVYGSYYTPALLQAGKIATDVSGNFVGTPLWKTLLKVMGLGADNLQQTLGNTNQTVPVDSFSVWDNTIDNNPSNASTFTPQPVRDGTEKSPVVKNMYQMSNPAIYIGYTAFFYIGDGYGGKGYTGPVADHETYLLPGGDIHYVGDFTLNSHAPGT